MGVCNSQRKQPLNDFHNRPLKKSSDRQATGRSPTTPPEMVGLKITKSEMDSNNQDSLPMNQVYFQSSLPSTDTGHLVDFTPGTTPEIFQRLNTPEESKSEVNRGRGMRLSVDREISEMWPSTSDAAHTIDGDAFGRPSKGSIPSRRSHTFARAGRRGTLSVAKKLQSVSTLLTTDEIFDPDQQVDCVDNLNDLLESQKILTRLQSCGDYLSKRLPTNSKRSSSSARKSILTQATKRKLQNDMIEGTKLKDVVQIFPKDIKHPEAINYWREFEHIKFWKSPTVSRVIRQILQTQIPEIGVSYQVIIDEFLHQDWPINIFLHGGLMRDIMTSTIGNDVDIAFTCPHTEMKKICDGKNWKCSIRKDIPYWVIGGESNFETKLEGFPLSFNGLSRFHIADFACNTIYYDCKNQILIDRYGRGVDSALAKKLTLPIFTWDDRVKWRDTDFLPGVKMYRFFKFVTRGFDYDIEAAKFIQESLVDYVENDPEGAQQSCFHALRKLARGQDSQQDAHKYKKKLKKSVKELFVNLVDDETKSSAAIKREADAYWNESWETIVNKVINQGVFTKGLDLKNANEQWNSEIDIGDGYEESDYDENFGTRVVSGDEVGDTPCSEEQTKKGLGDHVQTIVKLSCSLESIEFHQASPQLLAELIE